MLCYAEVFASGGDQGQLRIWELSHYLVRGVIQPFANKGGSKTLPGVTCLEWTPMGLISGWADGIIRCHEPGSAQQLWEV
jgi:WD40 repeat protein